MVYMTGCSHYPPIRYLRSVCLLKLSCEEGHKPRCEGLVKIGYHVLINEC